MRITFLGLGNMGRPMAANLVADGHEVVLWNRTRSKAEELAGEIGGDVAAPAGAASGAEVAVTMLSDDEAVEAVVFGADGVIEGLEEGAVHASMSTISPAFSRRLADAHAGRGQGYVAAAIEAMGEAFALVSKYGVDPADFLEVANGGVIRSPVYEAYGGLMVEEAWEPAGFALEHGLKDIRYGLSAGDEAAVPMPVASAIRDRFLTAVARGDGELDWAALGKVAAEAAGLD